MANNFVDSSSFKQEYLFKLIPDLSVFDVVERYFIDNNKSPGIDGLFFYSNDTSVSGIKFRRFIVKSNGEISTTPEYDDDPNFVYHSFSINNDKYLIIIDEQNKAGNSGFTVTSTGGNYLIGVCF